jgi:hypothetical protein
MKLKNLEKPNLVQLKGILLLTGGGINISPAALSHKKKKGQSLNPAQSEVDLSYSHS